MRSWKAAGRASRADEDELWGRFKTAQDKFFRARSEVYSAKDAALREHANVKAQLLEDLMQPDEGEDWSQKPAEERPRCATCGKPLWARGEQTRYIQTTGGEAVKLTRAYGTCPTCGVGFFPSG